MSARNKYARQLDLIDPELLATPIRVIGAGGIGSWATLAITKMGCHNVSVQDFDRVEMENTASQIYGEKHIKMTKVDALREIIKELSEVDILPVMEKWVPEQEIVEPILISGLDSLDTRGELWTSVKKNKFVKWYIDGRMSGNIIRLYTVKIGEDNSFYEKTLVTDKNVEEEACTSKAVIYNTFMCGSLIANLVKKIIKGEEYKREIIVDLFNLEIL